MRSMLAKTAIAAFLLGGAYAPATAGSLQVEPVIIDVTAPGAASTITLHNGGQAPIHAQVRVFRWSLVTGEEKLEAPDDVVASPPSATLAPNGKNIVRIVRVAKQPVVGEERYRLLGAQTASSSETKHA